MTVIAGVDVGNATTEVVVVADGAILGAGRAPTRGRKGSPDSLRGAAAVVRRVARQTGAVVDEARIAPLRPVETSVRTVPDVPPPTGRLRVLRAGVATPGGAGACVGVPLLLGSRAGTRRSGRPGHRGGAAGNALRPGGGRHSRTARGGDAGRRRARRMRRGCSGRQPAARRNGRVPVIDQVDSAAAASCTLLAVEVRPPGHPLTTLADPVALAAAFGLGERDAGDAATISRSLLDYSNAVVGLTPDAMPAPHPASP